MAKSAGSLQASVWLQVFGNSKVNGAPYDGENLPVHAWAWPKGTYLQSRLRAVRADWGQSENVANGNDSIRSTPSFMH